MTSSCGCKMVGKPIGFGVQIEAKLIFCHLHAAAPGFAVLLQEVLNSPVKESGDQIFHMRKQIIEFIRAAKDTK